MAVDPDIDEALFKLVDQRPDELALELASAKSVKVSSERPDDWVVGSDSVVTVQGAGRIDKPAGREEAAEHLRLFSGRPIELTSAVALARGGSVDWRHCETATLQVRPLSDAFIEDYLDSEWPDVGYCVGVFRLEGRGVQLFDRIDGNHFAILGMPLLPLLAALRDRGLLRS
jgi:septum formation protein